MPENKENPCGILNWVNYEDFIKIVDNSIQENQYNLQMKILRESWNSYKMNGWSVKGDVVVEDVKIPEKSSDEEEFVQLIKDIESKGH